MSAIESMINQSWHWRNQHKAARRPIDACIAGIRLHALLDAYEALGGNDTPWRNEVGILRDDQ